ncbi:MAG: bifunctional phosphoribosyl-AMP cyclohydrolase/phosphoribosyl-ATP diphosphatase HisIE [Bacillota bacterium]
MSSAPDANCGYRELATDAVQTPDLNFSPDGLIPAIVQDESSGQVLMLAYMNRESLRRTLETGRTWFWSRSRKALWLKGETSGHCQVVKGIYVDCDKDALLIKVDQTGVACHEGRFSCFYREIAGGGEIVDVGGATTRPATAAVLDEIYSVVRQRKENPSCGSYVSRLMQSGLDRILRKVGEEAGEFIIASKNDARHDTVAEVADLWFHSMVALAYLGIPISRVYEELAGRRKGTDTSQGTDTPQK